MPTFRWYSWLMLSCVLRIFMSCNPHVGNRLVSVRWRSLYVYSFKAASLWVVLGCCISDNALKSRSLSKWSHQMLVPTWCGNSYILSSKVGKSYYMARNLVLSMLDLCCLNIGADVTQACALNICGYISENMMRRCLPLSNALCLRATVNSLLRINDLGNLSLLSTSGVVGVKVGTISWTTTIIIPC